VAAVIIARRVIYARRTGGHFRQMTPQKTTLVSAWYAKLNKALRANFYYRRKL
jgi:hypothetical protein